MVGYGRVKFFNKKELYGFFYVLDENGEMTEEEVHFHFNNGHYPKRAADGSVRFDMQSTGTPFDEQLSFPDGTFAQIVWERRETDSKPIIVWTHRRLWDDMRRYGTLHPLRYRVIRTYAGRPNVEIATASPEDLSPGGLTVREGSCSPAQLVGADPGFPQFADHGNDELVEATQHPYRYQLQLYTGDYSGTSNGFEFVRFVEPNMSMDEYWDLRDSGAI